MKKFISEDGQVITEEELHKLQKEDEKYDSPIIAGLAGAARGGTFGLSDVLLTKSGAVKPETLSKLEEYNPESSITGELVGVLGTSFIPGSPVARMGQFGQKISKLVAQKIGAHEAKSTAGRIALKAAAAGAGSAVEGVLYSTGHLVSESALGRPEKNAEDIIAHLGMGAVLGGGIGSTFKLGSQVIPKAAKSASEYLIPRMQAASQKAWNAYAKLSSFVSGADKQYIKEHGVAPFTEQGYFLTRKKIQDNLTSTDKITHELTDSIKEIIKTSDEFSNEFREITRPFERKILDETKISEALKSANNLNREAKSAISAMTKFPDTYERQSLVKLTKAFKKFNRNTFQQGIYKLAKEDPGVVQKIYRNMDDFKVRLDDMIEYQKRVSPTKRDTQEKLVKLRGFVKRELEDENLWGVTGARQSATNSAWTDYIRAKEKLLSASYGFGKKNARGYMVFAPEKMHAFVTKLHKQGSAEKQQTLKDYIDASKRFIDVVGSGRIGVEETSRINSAFASRPGGYIPELYDVKNKEKIIHSAMENLKDANKLRQTKWYSERQTGLDIGAVGASVLTGLVDPLSGAIVGGTYGLLKSPARAVQILTWMEKQVFETNKKVYSNSLKFLKSASVQGKRAAISSVGRQDDKKDNKELVYYQPNMLKKREQYEKNLENYSQVASGQNLEMLSEKLGDFTEYAPETSAAIIGKAGQAIQMLFDAIPKSNQSFTLNLAPKIPPSDYEIQQFAKIERLLAEPMSIFESLDENSITTQQVEILGKTYPEFYNNIVNQFTKILTEEEFELPYAERISLSILLNTPLDNSLRPEFIQMIQQQQGINEQKNQMQEKKQRMNTAQIAKAKSPESVTTSIQKSLT